MKKSVKSLLCGLLIGAMLSGSAFASTTSVDDGDDVLFFAGETPIKSAPEILEIMKSDGTPLGDIIFIDENSNPEDEGEDCLLVTAASKREYSSHEEIEKRLDDSMSDILDSSSILDLDPLQISDAEEEQKAMQELIEEACPSIDVSLDNFDAAEVFDVTAQGDVQNFMHTYGSYLDITFNVKVRENERLLVMITQDGNTWDPVSESDVIVNYNENVVVRLRKTGTVGFFVAPILNKATDSSTGRIAPYAEYVNRAFTEQGFTLNYLPREGIEAFDTTQSCVLASPLAYRENAPEQEITERLQKSFDSIRKSPALSDLTLQQDPDATEVVTMEERLLEVLRDMGSSAKPEDLIVTDLFDLTAYGECAEYLAEDENNALDFKFDVQIPEGSTFMVITSQDGESWYVLPADCVAIAPNEYVLVRMYDLGATAFIMTTEEQTYDQTNAQGEVTNE